MIFILVDALKSTYLDKEYMPFLYDLSNKYYTIKEVIPCAGFCERSEIFSGLDGYDTGNFTAIGYSPDESPYKYDGIILFMCSLLAKLNLSLANRMLKRWRKLKNRRMNFYRIPYSSLKNFALTEDGKIRYTNYSTLFDILRINSKSYTVDGLTALSDLSPRLDESIQKFLSAELEKNTYFIPIYVGDLDSVGHKYGNDIKSIIPYLQKVDDLLRELYEKGKDYGYSFSVLGDHGMVPVTSKVNIMKAISSTDLMLGKDYEVFYDSTMVRFWFFNSFARYTIVNLLKDEFSSFGFIVTPDIAPEYRIPMDITNEDKSRVYGDIIWCANSGVLVSPDYFHSEQAAEKGMHGYIHIEEGDGTGLFVADFKTGYVDKLSSSCICKELCEGLQIELPNDNNWNRTRYENT